MALGLAWLLVWLMTLMASAEAAYSFYLEQNQEEGFAALLGMAGVLVLGPLGFVSSILVAKKMGRLWPFFAGAAITGIGTVAFILFAFA